MIYKVIDSYTVMETLRRAAQRTRSERWLDKFNALFWKILGV